MNRKILIISIFAILLLLIIPVITANNLNKHTYSKVTENQKVLHLDIDIYEEIITFIEGTANGVKINRRGLIRDVEFWDEMGLGMLEIDGRRKPWESFNVINIIYIHAYRFIGFIIPTAPGYGRVYGIAIGNIDWIK